MQDPAEQLALARYAAIGPAVGQGLSDRERRERLREQAQPFGVSLVYTRIYP